MTEADDHLFCLLTMNHHPLHINDVYAAESQQGRNVVVGPLVCSLALGMSVADVSGKAIADLATEELSHPAPVFHALPLFAESEVLDVRPSQSKADRGVVKVHARVQAGRHARRRVQACGARAAPHGRGVARPARCASTSWRRAGVAASISIRWRWPRRSRTPHGEQVVLHTADDAELLPGPEVRVCRCVRCYRDSGGPLRRAHLAS